MESTSGTPHLLTDVRFDVKRKGYDPDQVDNFLERVSAAVAQLQDKLRQSTTAAEAAETRAADAVRNESRLQSRVAELESGGAVTAAPRPIVVPVRNSDPEAEAEAASSVLVMAQRTADATINDARTSAAHTIAEAEHEATRVLSAAHARADEAVLELERTRRELVADNQALDAFVAEQRAHISAGVAQLQSVLDDPTALRVGIPPVEIDPAPAVSAAPAPSPVNVSTRPPVPPSEPTELASFQPVLADSDWKPAAEPVSLFPSDDGPSTETVMFTEGETDFLEGEGGEEDEADSAMRRFFDADFDDDDRFGR